MWPSRIASGAGSVEAMAVFGSQRRASRPPMMSTRRSFRTVSEPSLTKAGEWRSRRSCRRGVEDPEAGGLLATGEQDASIGQQDHRTALVEQNVEDRRPAAVRIEHPGFVLPAVGTAHDDPAVRKDHCVVDAVAPRQVRDLGRSWLPEVELIGQRVGLDVEDRSSGGPKRRIRPSTSWTAAIGCPTVTSFGTN